MTVCADQKLISDVNARFCHLIVSIKITGFLLLWRVVVAVALSVVT